MSEGEENKFVERLVDIGAGFGELFIDRAKKEPGKNFIIIEPFGFPDPKELPPNLTWIKGRLADQEALPLEDVSVDEVNMNFSLSAIFADFPGSDEEFIEYLPGLLREGLRVLKNGGRLVIREERGFYQNILGPVLNKLMIDFDLSQAKDQDLTLTGQEMLADYRANPDKNQRSLPMEITIAKREPRLSR